MWRHYVYIHFRESDGSPFYVGKGSARQRERIQNYSRAREEHKNLYWQNIVNKHGILINIIASCKTDEEAQKLEKEIIAQIGRENLVNMTDGGDGFCGLEISDELRAKRSEAAKGPRSENWIMSIRLARKNGGNGDVVKHGDKLPQSWKDNISKAKVGSKNPMFGKVTPVARKVIDEGNGKIYDSVSAAAKDYKLNMKSLYNMLSGHRKNFTELRFM